VIFYFLTVGARWLKIAVFVFAGLATTKHFTSGLATDKALDCSTKIYLFFESKSFLSIPGLRGYPPINTIMSASLNCSKALSP